MTDALIVQLAASGVPADDLQAERIAAAAELSRLIAAVSFDWAGRE
ncbi:MAG: hypothetical protein H0U19_13095 [Acidobacteria bacterium]|nr:hypothetical protein [Acidobacteriota bacterium]